MRDSTTPYRNRSVHAGRAAVVDLITRRPGISDREIAAALFGAGAASSLVKGMGRALCASGATRRRLRDDGLLGNDQVMRPYRFAAD